MMVRFMLSSWYNGSFKQTKIKSSTSWKIGFGMYETGWRRSTCLTCLDFTVIFKIFQHALKMQDEF